MGRHRISLRIGLFTRRFLGKDPEPRPGLSSGHMPHSLSLPFNVFLKTHTAKNSSAQFTKFLTLPEIHQALIDSLGAERTALILKGERSVITTCGSGMTAAVLWLGLKLLSVENVGLYDESWTGYASRASSTIEKSID
jgi:thiosulfate/3-mercaptopyruvate sulfurtransferase